MKMKILDCNQIKRNRDKEKNLDFINLEIIGEEDKEKNYIHLVDLRSVCFEVKYFTSKKFYSKIFSIKNFRVFGWS